MAYPNNENDMYWSHQHAEGQGYFNNDIDYGNLQSSQLDFQTFTQDTTSPFYTQSAQNKSYMDGYNKSPSYPEMLTPNFQDMTNQSGEYDEPPLLEELEIYPDRIWEKTLAVLNPFRSHSLADDADFLSKESDLAGPFAYCVLLAFGLFLSGSKVDVGYIYGVSAICSIMMFMLLTLMTPKENIFTIANVTSILGYCLLPSVALSIIRIFFSLHGFIGYVVAVVAVIWSSLSSSRLYVAMSGDQDQRPLIAYPCGLVYGVFALLILF